MVLSVASGYSPEYLLKEVATGRENYYTGAVTDGEPPGRWWGAGAEKLGLTGLVEAQDMRAVYERFLDPRAEGFSDPELWDDVDTLGHAGRKYKTEEQLYAAAVEREPGATGERLAELRTEAGKKARHNVAFFDLTFNVQKSVTLVHTAFEAQETAARQAGDEETAAAWAQFRTAVEDAIWAGNNAGLAYFAEKAGYTRTGHHGGEAGRWADAHGWTVASFLQHDSREHDPHLHIHNALLNRVEDPEGVWLTLDGQSLYRWRPAAAAVAERTMEEHLSHALGVLVATRPDGKAREIVGVVQEAMDLISTRRHQVTAKTQELVDAYEQRYGRAPNGLQRERLAQQATLATRAAKSHTGESRNELLDRIDSRIRADIDGGLAGVAHTVLGARPDAVAAQEWSPQAVIEVALEQVQSTKAGWTKADLTSAINTALPDHLGITDGRDIGQLLDSLTDKALQYATTLDQARPGDELLPAELRLDNGDSSYQAPGSRLYATPEHVRTERALVAATASGGAAALPHPVPDRFLRALAESGIELGPDQAAAVRGVLTSGARVETLVGPAGTGKSFIVGTIAQAWNDPAHAGGPDSGVRRVFGLATSQIATEVLKAEGLDASNVAAWLAAQRRLSAGAGSPGPRPIDADQAWRLRAGDLVVVDESAMTDTAALAAIHQHVDTAGAKLLLVGDHRQLAAVGAGGAMDLVAASGARYELAEARRFNQEWERSASLRLRDGDESVLRDYHQHGRLLDAGTRDEAEASAAAAWLGDTLAGRRSLLVVDTNEQAARVSSAIRAELVRLGQVQEDGVQLGLQGTYAGVGDLVEARKLDWTLAGYEGNPRGAINREHYRVQAVRPDGGLEVAVITGRTPDGDVLGGRLVLPPAYVAGHLALGYASTVHAAQGGTVDTTHTIVSGRTGPAGLYVGMSRGRDANTAHVITRATVDDPARGDERHELHRDPIAVLVGQLSDRDSLTSRSAVAIADESAAVAGSTQTAGERLADAAHIAATARTVGWLDQLTAAGHLSPEQRARIAAEDGAPSLARVLRRAELAGHDPHQLLVDAVAERPLTGAKNTTNVLHARITDGNTRRFDPVGTTWADWKPRTGDHEWDTYLDALAAAADQRTAELGRVAAKDAPVWAVEALGAVPEDPREREHWQQRAGAIAAYRELRGHDDPADALGPAPTPGQVEAYAAYRNAWRAAGRPDIDRAEHEMSDGLHRMRIIAWEREKAWGPRYVGNELAGTHQAADQHRRTAALRAAEADAAADPADRDRLHTESAQAAALAATLDGRIAELEKLDDARAVFLGHTAVTRSNAEVSQYILAERHAHDTEPEPRVTAQEWLDAENAARIADDENRAITEHDLQSDNDDHGAAVQRHRTEDVEVNRDNEAGDDHRDDGTAAAVPDVRDVAAAEPKQTGEDIVQEASAQDTAAAIARARRSLAEIEARRVLDACADEDERTAEAARWATDESDLTDHTDQHDDAGDVFAREPAELPT